VSAARVCRNLLPLADNRRANQFNTGVFEANRLRRAAPCHCRLLLRIDVMFAWGVLLSMSCVREAWIEGGGFGQKSACRPRVYCLRGQKRVRGTESAQGATPHSHTGHYSVLTNH